MLVLKGLESQKITKEIKWMLLESLENLQKKK